MKRQVAPDGQNGPFLDRVPESIPERLRERSVAVTDGPRIIDSYPSGDS